MSKEFKKKPFDELSITDNYMFQAVMRDPKLVKPLLEMIFEKKIRNIEIIEQEKTIETGYDSRGIRMDVYVEMDGKPPKSEYSRMLDEAVKKVKLNNERRSL